MSEETSPFSSVSSMLDSQHPRDPVYCTYPHIYQENAKAFLRGFAGRVLYAVKANNHPAGSLPACGRDCLRCARITAFPAPAGRYWRWLSLVLPGILDAADGGFFSDGFRSGPTCDSSDVLPGEVELPRNIQAGDYLEFGNTGAYSLSGRTSFNGHYSDCIVEITSTSETPP